MADRLGAAQQRLKEEHPDPTAGYLTIEQVTRLAHCEHKKVRRAIAAGKLEAFRPGRRLIVREEDAHAWIESTLARPPLAHRSSVVPSGRAQPGSVARLRELDPELSR